MITRTERAVPAGSQLEVRLHWAEDEPPVVAHIDEREARALIARLAFADPDELEAAVTGAPSASAVLILGLQAYYRRLRDEDGDLAVADVEGALWTIPAREVRAIRLRLLPDRAGSRRC